MRPFLALLSALLCLILTSCGGDSSSNSNSDNDVSLGLLIGDAPTDTLSSATLTLAEFRLILASGGVTENLLGAPRTLDVLGLGLENQEALLDYVDGEEGDYIGIRATIEPTSVELRDLDGMMVPVQVVASEADALFSTTASGDLRLDSGDFASLSLDIDLDASLSGNGSGFDFSLSTNAGHGDDSSLLDEFDGQVTSINRPAKWFEVRITDARQQSTSLGRLRVFVEDSDMLFNFSGAAFGNSNAFLAALDVDDFVEVEGRLLQNGDFDASRCEIEDSSRSQVRMEGRVLSVDDGNQTFDFLLEEIEKGYSIARPVLSALGDPGVLQIAWDDQTQFLKDDSGSGSSSSGGSGGQASSNDLVPGMEVDVRIDESRFNAPMPFLARSVRLDYDERYEGMITAVDGLPGSFMLNLDNSHPGVTSGRISGPVQVNLGSQAVLFLDAGLEPALQPQQLLIGLKVKIDGQLTGSGNNAILSADRVKVEPGELEALAESFSATERRLTIVISEVDDPFGEPEPNMTAGLIVAADAVIELDGEVVSFAELRSAFENRAAGEFMELEVEGIGDGNGDVIGYEIEAELDD